MSRPFPARVRPAVTWTRVDAGFYVGSRLDGFIGYIAVDPGGVAHATRGDGRGAGRFSTLQSAKEHLGSMSSAAA